jgi:hypothetical protein
MLESGVLGAALLGVTALLMGAVIWLAVRRGWDRRDAAQSTQRLDEALKAKEIEDEIEALPPDALRDRAKLWVRNNTR